VLPRRAASLLEVPRERGQRARGLIADLARRADADLLAGAAEGVAGPAEVRAGLERCPEPLLAVAAARAGGNRTPDLRAVAGSAASRRAAVRVDSVEKSAEWGPSSGLGCERAQAMLSSRATS
jgi:hypothetical protein